MTMFMHEHDRPKVCGEVADLNIIYMHKHVLKT